MHLKDFLKKSSAIEKKELAEKAGISYAYLYQLASGYRGVTKKMAIKLEQASGGKISRVEACFPELNKKPVKSKRA